MDSKFAVNSDSYLWDRFRAGDEQAFAEIYTIFVDVLFQYGIKFTRDEQLVKDCIQELFVEIHSRRQTLGKTNNIKFYLLKSIKRSIIRALRTKSSFSPIDEMGTPFIVSYSQSDDTEDEAAKKSEAVQKALKELTPRQKEAIYLRFSVGLSYQEICETLEMNNQSVRNLIFRAVEKMRNVLFQTNLFLFLAIKRCFNLRGI